MYLDSFEAGGGEAVNEIASLNLVKWFSGSLDLFKTGISNVACHLAAKICTSI